MKKHVVDPSLPPIHDEQTHGEYMGMFASFLVSTTKNSSSLINLIEQINKTFAYITGSCRQQMVIAAKKSNSSAVIFAYKITDEPVVGGDYSIFDIMFPVGALKDQMKALGIASLYERLRDYLKPLAISHEMIIIRGSSVTRAEIADDPLGSAGEYHAEILRVMGNPTLAGAHFCGTITATWDKLL